MIKLEIRMRTVGEATVEMLVHDLVSTPKSSDSRKKVGSFENFNKLHEEQSGKNKAKLELYSEYGLKELKQG